MQQIDKFENTKTANSEDWLDVPGTVLGGEDGCDLYSADVLERSAFDHPSWLTRILGSFLVVQTLCSK